MSTKSITLYHLIRKDTDYHDLGPTYLNEYRRRDLDKNRIRRARTILETNGYTVTHNDAA